MRQPVSDQRSILADSLPLLIAWRFLRGRQSRLVDGTARAALVATTLGVTAMVVAMALMTGYREDLQRKLIGGNAAIVAYPIGGERPPSGNAQIAALESLPGVEEVGLVAYAQGSLANPEAGVEVDVTLRGIAAGKPLPGGERLDLSAAADGIYGVVLGRELASRLDAGEGEVLRLVALGFPSGRARFRYRSLRVVGTFSSGFAEFDQTWAVTDRALVERLSGLDTGADLYELALADPRRAADIAGAVRRVLGPDFLVTDWQELNRELFTALEVQQLALFFVLGLIVLVSTFNVGSTLVVLVRERMREVGVLEALGLSPPAVRAVFLLYGGALGLVGTGLGIAIGSGLAWILTEFELIRFDPEVAAIYFISSVPFRVRAPDVLAVAVFTLVITLAACWAPARRASRVNPSRALRYE